jgi:anti-anti-sigma factor
MNEFRLTSRMDTSGVVRIEIRGDLDRSTADRLVNALGVYQQPIARCVIDVSACDFIDSSGLRALLQCQARLEPPHQLVLTGVRPNVERALELVSMRSMFAADAVDRVHSLTPLGAAGCA